MKNWKLYASIIVLVLMVGLFGYSVYASLRSYVGIANKTEFVTGDENVFVRIDANYEGPTPQGTGYATEFFYELNRTIDDAFNETPVRINDWYIGTTNFIAHEQETIAFVFEITNLNTVNNLQITFSNIASDYEERFLTKIYEYAVGAEKGNGSVLTPASSTALVATSPIYELLSGQAKTYRIEFTLNTYSKDFQFDNNMKVTFATPE